MLVQLLDKYEVSVAEPNVAQVVTEIATNYVFYGKEHKPFFLLHLYTYYFYFSQTF